MRSAPLTTPASWLAVPDHPLVTADTAQQRSGWIVLAWFLIAAVGAIHAWASRQAMNPDGISYLDLAHAFLRGDWSLAINRLWSPLYPLLLAVVLRVLPPAPYQEFTTVHVLNFVIFLGALASFEFLLTELLRHHRTFAARAASDGRMTLPEWALRLVGYALFAYSAFQLMTLLAVGPDMLVSAFVYLALGLVLKLRRQPGTPAWLLGVVLGLGYLAKAPMLPLAFLFLALAMPPLDGPSSFRRIWQCLFAALIPFALIAGSLVLAHALTGRGVTLGESGRLNYAWHVNGLPYVHWQGDPPGSGRPVHPTRKLFSSPPVYEFAIPVGGTYPPWDDPAYWYEGVKIHFAAGSHLHTIARSARALAGMLVRSQLSLVMGGLLLFSLGRRGRLFLQDTRPFRPLVIPAFAAVSIFSLIWLEPRFIAPFVTPFWLGVFAPMTFPKSRGVERMVARIVIAMLALLVLVSSSASYRLARGLLAQQDVDSQLAVAQALHRLGLHSGDAVAVIWGTRGAPYASWDAYWARLSQLRIIAEIPQCPVYAGSFCVEGQPDGVTAFLQADQGTRNRILGIFKQTGAQAVVMRGADQMGPQGWHPIAGTDYSVYLLKDQALGEP